MAITFEKILVSADPLLDLDLRDLVLGGAAAAPVLYAATGQNGGVSLYSLGPGGGARLVDSAYYTTAGMGLGQVVPLDIDDQARLVLGGVGTGQWLGWGLAADGTLGVADTLTLPTATTGSTTAPGALVSLALGNGTTAVYSVAANTGQIQGWHSDGAGAITGTLRLKGTSSSFDLGENALLALAEVPTVASGAITAPVLIAAGAAGIHSYALGRSKGGVVAVDVLGPAQGLGIATPTAVGVVQAFGSAWVVLAASTSNSLSVMELGAGGDLRPTDHLVDTLHTRFGGASALKLVTLEDRVLVLAGGGDDGISLFTLLPGGRLVHLHSLAHDTGLGLANIHDIEAVQLGDQLQIFVAGEAAGVAEFSLSLADLGAVIQPGAGRGAVAGTSGDDLMVARPESGPLRGLGGDDILVAGVGGGTLTGGDGADTFVLSAAEQSLKIIDFQAGVDRLDLSGFAMLRSLSQLETRETDTGIVLKIGATRITIVSQDGAALSLADLWPRGFETADHFGFNVVLPRLVLTGTKRADDLQGGTGNDRIMGKGGDELMLSYGGNDRLFGGVGKDHINGGEGRDLVKGQGGRDRLEGGARRDRLVGGGGGDELQGGVGNDRLTGGKGADHFVFDQEAARGTGRDRVTDFTPGQDQIHLIGQPGGFAQLRISKAGSDTVIALEHGQLILSDLAPGRLAAEDFLFA